MNRVAVIITFTAVMLMTPWTLCAESAREDIHADATLVQPLMPGMKAPSFNLKDANGAAVAFDPATMEKPLVLTFFRGGWCPYCNMHLAEMRHAEAELEDLGYDIWFVSVDKPEIIYASLEEPDIGYVVLSDAKLEATRAFDIAFQLPDEMVEKYVEYGIDLEALSGENHHVLPAPSTYIIGADGVIQFQYTNPNYSVRLHPDVLLAAARGHVKDADLRLAAQYRKMREEQEAGGN